MVSQILCYVYSIVFSLKKVVSNGQSSEWRKVFLNILQCIVKIFADDTSLFSLAHDINKTWQNLAETQEELLGGRISGRYHSISILLSKLWRLTFCLRSTTPPVQFNNLEVGSCETHKHLGLLLGKRLTFDRYVEEMIMRANKSIGLIPTLCKYLPRNSLSTIYKVFIRPHLDYGDVVYDYPGHAAFMEKLESA